MAPESTADALATCDDRSHVHPMVFVGGDSMLGVLLYAGRSFGRSAYTSAGDSFFSMTSLLMMHFLTP